MLVLNEDQRMLMDSARGAIAAKAPIAMWRQLRAEASPDGFSRAFCVNAPKWAGRGCWSHRNSAASISA